MSMIKDPKELLELFGLEEADVEDCSYRNVGGNAFIDITLARKDIPCPECGSANPKIKGYYLKKLDHAVLTDRKCTVMYHARRYECRFCHHTYAEHNPFAFGSMSISALTVMNVLDDLHNYNETFSSVAARYHISPTSAASIFDDHVQISRRPLPEMLCFDEVYAFHHYSDKYVCVLLDFNTGKPVDLLNSRRKEILISYFQKIPLEERKKVKACSFDMYDTYRSVMRSCFPNSIGIVDHYHMCQELGRDVDAIRIRIMKGTQKKSDEYYLLKNFNWMLFKHYDVKDKNNVLLFDSDHKRKYNQHFNKYMNYYELREKLLDIHPDLRKAHELYEDVYDFYRNNTPENGEKELNELIGSFRESGISELIAFAKTMTKWRVEIINSLQGYGYTYKTVKGTGHVAPSKIRMSNAIIENRNSIIKCVKKNAAGYTNWDRFRNRLMYVLDKDANYSLNPIIHDKKAPKNLESKKKHA